MKRIVSFVLAVVLALSMVLPTFAATEHSPEVCENEPVIIIRGMDFTGLYYDVGTENEKPVLEIDAGEIVKAVFKAIFAGIISMNFDKTMDVVVDFAGELLGGLAMDKNGDPIGNVGPKKYPGSVAEHPDVVGGTVCEMGMITGCAEAFGADHTYYFTYDWRMDPYDIADEIHETVERACEETGHDKVKLVCASMGGVMTVAYLSEYGYSRVSKILFMSSTFCGTQLPSDLMQGKIEFKAETIANIALYSTQDNAALNGLLKALDFLGVFKLAEKLAGMIVDNYVDEVNDKVLMPVLAYMPVMWALVQPEDFDSCVDFIFGDSMKENAAFIERITALHEMMEGRNELLYEMIDNGVKIAVVSNYGAPCIPVYESASELCGDVVLEAYQTSGYATIAPYGETLGEDYVAKNPEYLSPDRMVDLSTAVLPEYTYMIKGAPHVASSYGTDYGEFFIWLLSYDGEDFTAGVNPDYPQFMLSGNDESLSKFPE